MDRTGIDNKESDISEQVSGTNLNNVGEFYKIKVADMHNNTWLDEEVLQTPPQKRGLLC